jgi:hypothetical protein
MLYNRGGEGRMDCFSLAVSHEGDDKRASDRTDVWFQDFIHVLHVGLVASHRSFLFRHCTSPP